VGRNGFSAVIVRGGHIKNVQMLGTVQLTFSTTVTLIVTPSILVGEDC